ECRATWDIEFPAIVASWTLPAPKEFPDKHGNMLLAVKAMERQLLAAPNTKTNIAAVQSGSFAAPEGLLVFVSVVWNKGTPIENAFAIFESETGKIAAASSFPDWLKTERQEIALPFAPRWYPGKNLWNASSPRHLWGTNHYRYALLLENEEQYKILAKSIDYAAFYSVQRAFGKELTKDKRTMVVLMPQQLE
ncbi:MAG: hypothetical protein FWE67_07925, partial [Planctomycetaceae bacterium]|nr:hypothetical protein [Planctomycetaceae bacterium]